MKHCVLTGIIISVFDPEILFQRQLEDRCAAKYNFSFKGEIIIRRCNFKSSRRVARARYGDGPFS